MKKTKKLVICAILSSIGVALILLGTFLQFIDVSVAFIVALIPLFCLAEFGIGWSIGVYLVISILSILIVGPESFAAFCFAFFTGLWPALKYLFEKQGKVWSWVVKMVYINVMFIISYLVFAYILQLPDVLWQKILYLVLGNLVFVLADIMYTRLMKLYFFNVRDKISRFLK